jgi:hypothetical protein
MELTANQVSLLLIASSTVVVTLSWALRLGLESLVLLREVVRSEIGFLMDLLASSSSPEQSKSGRPLGFCVDSMDDLSD